ncbi:MAG: 4-vinyl reductase [Candidatus Thermoplasmatota archaeon]|nr:4-vinyl reductase [Candidatus Thermoplasmatota archaeon]
MVVIEVPPEMIDALHSSYNKEIVVDHQKGILRYKNVPIFWSRSEMLYNMYREMVELMGPSAGTIMERATRPHGGGFIAFLKAEKSESKLDRVGMLRLVCADALATGWGKIQIVDEETIIDVVAEEGFPIGQMYRDKGERSPIPVDNYFLGYFTGVLSALDNKPYRGEELECLARGEERCRFRFKK